MCHRGKVLYQANIDDILSKFWEWFGGHRNINNMFFTISLLYCLFHSYNIYISTLSTLSPFKYFMLSPALLICLSYRQCLELSTHSLFFFNHTQTFAKSGVAQKWKRNKGLFISVPPSFDWSMLWARTRFLCVQIYSINVFVRTDLIDSGI